VSRKVRLFWILDVAEGIILFLRQKIIGSEGKVYAVDEDGYKLKDLQEKVKLVNLHNIEIIGTSGELNFGFEDAVFNTLLLYDIFWYFSLQSTKLSELLKGVYRVLKPDGLIWSILNILKQKSLSKR
jgi:ubiquinone/menaquinone biosynthesis C-methylase UbiE